MGAYNFFGTVNTLFIFISLFGVLSQLRLIWRRKLQVPNGVATELLSINQFTVSYLAYFSFFIYGYSIEPFNHYIVWPRLVATLLVGAILYEIWLDRKTKSSFYVLLGALLFLSNKVNLAVWEYRSRRFKNESVYLYDGYFNYCFCINYGP